MKTDENVSNRPKLTKPTKQTKLQQGNTFFLNRYYEKNKGKNRAP
jgi:hypothetical protein